jgi:hypothetical protein
MKKTIRRVKDLPPGASPELTVLMHLNERLAEASIFTISESTDTRTLLGVIIDLLKLVLLEQGFSKEQLQKALERSVAANQKNSESFVRERLKSSRLKAEE